MNEEQYAEVAAQLAANETEHKSFRRRLDDHDALLREQNKIVVAIEKQSSAIETMNTSMRRVETKVDGLSGRVDAMEREPAEKWKKVTWEIVKYDILALVGLAVGWLLKGGSP